MIFVPLQTYAQEEGEDLGTEVVNIVKPYTPTISDAFKVKETPVLNDSITTTKKKVNYGIFSVPVASTFTPAKGKAATVEKAKPIKLYDSYATLGFGNYTSVLGELYSNFQIDRTDNAGIHFKHNSSQGNIKGVLVEDKFYDTSLDANFTSRQRDMSYGVEAGAEHQIFHWYGLNDFFTSETIELFDPIDPKQSYFSAYLGGNINLDESVFEAAKARLRYTGDAFSSSEVRFSVQPEFVLPLTEFNLKITGELDFLSGKFERDYFNTGNNIEYGFLNAGVSPALVYVNDDLTLSLGAMAAISLDTKGSSTNFYLFPQVQASYRLVDELLIVYGGADGGLIQTNYFDLKSTNPFVSPTLNIMPTVQKYNAFGGLKGKLSNSVGYNLRASYVNENDKALFTINPFKGRLPNLEGYENGNSFRIIYDDVTTLDIFGELKVEVAEQFSLGINANIYSYNTTNQAEPWNLPELKITAFSHFSITDQIFGGASIFFVGERMDFFTTTQSGITTIPINEPRSLDSYIDLNLDLGYRVNDRLSIFAKGSNLLSDNYEKWLFSPVQGIQGLVGATYKFDW
ncbi:MAG: TonB-dependent receptor [Flavobacteriaceae bacterium]|nr:TonB-dependent receptor [Flavobacteriaceae bacterium]